MSWPGDNSYSSRPLKASPRAIGEFTPTRSWVSCRRSWRTGCAPAANAAKLPRKGRLYLDGPGGLADLTPLAVYLPESHEFYLLNARDDKDRGEYLEYRTGATRKLADFGGENRELITRALNMTPGEPPGDSTVTPDDSAGAKSNARRSVGEFELLGKLGQGGMGVVYRAVQPSLRRQVALKCMFKAGNPEWDRRFAREIRALGEVSHPNLVRIFQAGNEGDQWFYAMELLEGATLAAVSDQLQVKTKSAAGINHDTWRESFSSACSETRKSEEPLHRCVAGRDAGRATPPARGYVSWVVDLLRQTAEAAHALHEAKPTSIIHRDIKPGNIMVSPDGTRAVLVDLGLAQLCRRGRRQAHPHAAIRGDAALRQSRAGAGRRTCSIAVPTSTASARRCGNCSPCGHSSTPPMRRRPPNS